MKLNLLLQKCMRHLSKGRKRLYKWITGVVLTVFLFGVLSPSVSYAMQDKRKLNHVVDCYQAELLDGFAFEES